MKGRLGFLVCAVALAAVPLPARSANAVAFLVDRQGGTGTLKGTAGSFATFDIYGENFRAAVLQPPIVAVTTRSYGCVTFNGQANVTACGNNFTTTITGALSTAQMNGSATSGGYVITVTNVAITATGLPEPYVSSTADGGNICSPPLPQFSPTASPTPTVPPVPPVPPVPSPSPSPSVSPPPARTCFVFANPGLEREGVTTGTITLTLGSSTIGRANISDSGWIYSEALGELDGYTP